MRRVLFISIFVFGIFFPSQVNGQQYVFVDSNQEFKDPYGNDVKACSYDVTLRDMDGDGRIDAVVSTGWGPIIVWLNKLGLNGELTFQYSGFKYDGSYNLTPLSRNANCTFPIPHCDNKCCDPNVGLAVGDLNGDTKPDIFATTAGPNSFRVWLYKEISPDGHIFFEDTGEVFGNSTEDGGRRVVLHDFNCDGYLDVVVGNDDNCPNKIWWNNGEGKFSPPYSSPPLVFDKYAYYTWGVAVADLDGINGPDIVFANGLFQPNEIWFNNGDGSFTGTTFGSSSSMDIAIGDLDGKNGPDIFVANYGDYVDPPQLNEVYLNDGYGNFIKFNENFDGLKYYSWGAELADLDNDGDLDAVVANGSGHPNRVWLNMGIDANGNWLGFESTDDELGSELSVAIALGLLNDDDKIDAYVANHTHTPWQNTMNKVYINIYNPNTNPIAICKNIEIAADENGQAIISPEDIDNGSYDPDGDDFTLSIDNIGPFGLGEHFVNLTITDEHGASDTCTSKVIVVDQTAPVINVTVSPSILWPPNHKMILITPTFSVSDNCDPNPIVELTLITMNEGDETNTYDPNYDDNYGDGNTTNDIYVDDDGKIYLRAERSGSGTGRIYTITYTVTDASGNSSTTSVTVTVPHNM